LSEQNDRRVRRPFHHPSRYALRMVPLPRFRGAGWSRHICVDKRHRCRYICANQISPCRDAVQVMPGGKGRVCPRAKPHQLCSRAVRASCLPALRPAYGVRRWKWEGRRRSDPRPLDGFAHEAWPGSHQGTTHPLGRAVVERRQASAPESGRGGASRSFRGATRAPCLRAGGVTRVCRRSASLIFRHCERSEAIQSGG
jgi:hypothetical protein